MGSSFGTDRELFYGDSLNGAVNCSRSVHKYGVKGCIQLSVSNWYSSSVGCDNPVMPASVPGAGQHRWYIRLITQIQDDACSVGAFPMWRLLYTACDV